MMKKYRFLFLISSIILVKSLAAHESSIWENIHTNVLIIPEYSVEPLDTVEVEIQLHNQDSVFGFQFDILFDDSVRFLDSCWLSERGVDHQLVYALIEPGRLRFICFSMSQSAFHDTIGTILTIMFQSPNSQGEYDIEFENAILVGENFVNVLTDFVNGKIVVIPVYIELLDKGTPYIQKLAAYPNPFGGEVAIDFEANQAGAIQLIIFNSVGQLLFTKVTQIDTPGHYRFGWDCRDNIGNIVCSGVYYGVIKLEDGVKVFKLLLIR